jgi:hypothetical protein
LAAENDDLLNQILINSFYLRNRNFLSSSHVILVIDRKTFKPI